MQMNKFSGMGKAAVVRWGLLLSSIGEPQGNRGR
jgi:hypothetical protein